MICYTTLCEDLRRIYERTVFQPSRSSLDEMKSLAMAVFPRDGEGQTKTCSVLLAAGLLVPPAIQYLAWGIVRDGEHGPTLVGRTDVRGHFLVTLPDWTYRVRYVAELETELDRRILRRLGDAEALAQLKEEAAASIVSSPSLTWTCTLPGLAEVSFDDDDDGDNRLPLGVDVGLSKDKKWFRINYPIDGPHDVTFPYGAALMECVSDDGRNLANCVIPVVLDANCGRFVGELQLVALTNQTDVDARYLHCTEITDWGPEVFEKISIVQVEALLSDPYVKYDPRLLAKFRALRERL